MALKQLHRSSRTLCVDWLPVVTSVLHLIVVPKFTMCIRHIQAVQLRSCCLHSHGCLRPVAPNLNQVLHLCWHQYYLPTEIWKRCILVCAVKWFWESMLSPDRESTSTHRRLNQRSARKYCSENQLMWYQLTPLELAVLVLGVSLHSLWLDFIT